MSGNSNGLSGDVELGVVSITVETEVMAVNGVTRRGRSCEPWGTPRETGAVLEMNLLMLMN